MNAILQSQLLDSSTPDLVAKTPALWSTWFTHLHTSQELSKPVSPADITAWLEAINFPPNAPLAVKRSMFPEDFVLEQLTRERLISEGRLIELSALGTVVHQLEWSGVALLCNWAPTTFALAGQKYASIDSFYHALKFPEGSQARQECALAEPRLSKQVARRVRAKAFTHEGLTIHVGSAEHRRLFARALCAKIAQHPEVQKALKATCWSRLALPLTFTEEANVPGLTTALVLMLERFKRWGPTRGA